jgi:lambda family phage tail tape measure protein
MSIATEIRLRIKAEGEAVLQGLGDKLNKIAANATASSQKFSVLAGELKKVEATTGRSTTLLKQYSASWRELAGAVDIASKEFKEATAEAARLDAQIAKAEGRNRKAGSRLKTGAQVAGTAVAAGIFGGPEAAIGAVAGGIAGGVPGAVLGSTIGASVSQLRQALGATAAYEAEIKKLEIALKGVTTNQIEYNDALKFIQTSTDNYAVTQDILTRQFTKLQASVQGSGGSLQDTKIVFDGIVSAVRATGGSLQDVDSALTATAQVFSKGKVSAEELRQQIGERLPGAFTLFAKSMDMTPQQLDKALEGGKVSLKDFMVFAKELFDRYGENAKIIADSPAAAGDRLQIALSNLSKSIGVLLQPIGAAFQDTFTSIAEDITRATNALANFFGISGEALLRKNTLLIQAQTKVIKLNKDELARLAERQGPITVTTDRTRDVAAGLDAIRMSTLKTNISNAEKQRDKLRREINDAQRDPLVLPTADGKGLPGIDPGAGKDKKGGRGATAAANALAASKQRTEVLKQEAITLFDMALMQDKIYNLDQKSAKQAILDLTFEKDRLKILGEYDVKATKVDNTANKSAELKALQNKRNVELVALQLKFEAQRAELQREQEETGRKTLEGLRNELKIKKAVTQAERDSLRIAYEMELLEEGGTVAKSDLPRIQALKEQLAAPVLGDDLIRQQIGALSDELLVLTDVGTQVTSVAASIGDAFSTSFKGVISGSMSAREALAGFFRSVADHFLDMAAKIIAKMIQMAILNAIVKVLPGGSFLSAAGFGGSFDAGIPSLEGIPDYSGAFAKGDTFANGIAKFSRGGVVYDPTMFKFAQGGAMRTGVMGEAGPEAIMPLRRGRDGNLGVMSSGGGTTNVVVNVDASGSSVEGDQQQAKALGNAISAAVQSELVKQKRPGGLLA